MYCAYCGSRIEENAYFCPKCGKATADLQEVDCAPRLEKSCSTESASGEQQIDQVSDTPTHSTSAGEKKISPLTKKGKIAIAAAVAIIAAVGVGIFAIQGMNLSKCKGALISGDYETAASALSGTWFGNEVSQYKQLNDAFTAENNEAVFELADSSEDTTIKYGAGLWLMNRWSSSWEDLEKAAGYFSDAGSMESAEQNATTCSTASGLLHAEELLKMGRIKQGESILKELPSDFEWRNIKVAERRKLLDDYRPLLKLCGKYDLVQNDAYCNERTLTLNKPVENEATVECHLTDTGNILTTVSGSFIAIPWANEVRVERSWMNFEVSKVLKPLSDGKIYSLETSCDNATSTSMPESVAFGDVTLAMVGNEIILGFFGNTSTYLNGNRLPTTVAANYKKS